MKTKRKILLIQIYNNKLIEELNQLKLLNFNSENKLKYIDTKIKILSQNLINQKHKLKLINLPKNNEEEASQIYKLLHYKLIAKREKFKQL